MSHITESLLMEKNTTYKYIWVRHVVSYKIQITMHKEVVVVAAVRGLFVVFHRGILTYRSAATVQNRGVCFLLLNYDRKRFK